MTETYNPKAIQQKIDVSLIILTELTQHCEQPALFNTNKPIMMLDSGGVDVG